MAVVTELQNMVTELHLRNVPLKMPIFEKQLFFSYSRHVFSLNHIKINHNTMHLYA